MGGTTEANAGGTAADSNQVVVADVTGLVVGMELTYIVSATAPGSATTITAVNTTTKTLTLSRNQAITDGHTMTFRAYGPRLIQNAIGIGLSLTDPTVKLGQLVTSIDDEITSNISSATEFNVNGTLGVGAGATVRMRGLEKSEDAGAATVVTVDSSGNGEGITGGMIGITNARIIASADRPVRSGTKMYIDGSSNLVYLSGKIGIINTQRLIKIYMWTQIKY